MRKLYRRRIELKTKCKNYGSRTLKLFVPAVVLPKLLVCRACHHKLFNENV